MYLPPANFAQSRVITEEERKWGYTLPAGSRPSRNIWTSEIRGSGLDPPPCSAIVESVDESNSANYANKDVITVNYARAESIEQGPRPNLHVHEHSLRSVYREGDGPRPISPVVSQTILGDGSGRISDACPEQAETRHTSALEDRPPESNDMTHVYRCETPRCEVQGRRLNEGERPVDRCMHGVKIDNYDVKLINALSSGYGMKCP